MVPVYIFEEIGLCSSNFNHMLLDMFCFANENLFPMQGQGDISISTWCWLMFYILVFPRIWYMWTKLQKIQKTSKYLKCKIIFDTHSYVFLGKKLVETIKAKKLVPWCTSLWSRILCECWVPLVLMVPQIRPSPFVQTSSSYSSDSFFNWFLLCFLSVRKNHHSQFSKSQSMFSQSPFNLIRCLGTQLCLKPFIFQILTCHCRWF